MKHFGITLNVIVVRISIVFITCLATAMQTNSGTLNACFSASDSMMLQVKKGKNCVTTPDLQSFLLKICRKNEFKLKYVENAILNNFDVNGIFREIKKIIDKNELKKFKMAEYIRLNCFANKKSFLLLFALYCIVLLQVVRTHKSPKACLMVFYRV